VKIKIIAIIVTAIFALTQAAVNPAQVNSEVFFGFQPTSQAGALGLTGVTYQNWLNPAVDFRHDLGSSYSNSNSSDSKLDYSTHLAAISAQVHPDIGISAAHLNIIRHSDWQDITNYQTVSKISLNYRIQNNLFAGSSCNYFYNSIEKNISSDISYYSYQSNGMKNYTENAWSADFGLLYRFIQPNRPKREFVLAASCQNILATNLKNRTYDKATELPVILNLGAGWQFNSNRADWHDYNLQFHYQYRLLLNSRMRKMNSLGMEYTLNRLFTLRCGYSYDTGVINDRYDEQYTTKAVTYGSGLIFDLVRFFPQTNLPIITKIDCSLLTGTRTDSDYFDNWGFNSFTISAAYDLK